MLTEEEFMQAMSEIKLEETPGENDIMEGLLKYMEISPCQENIS